MLSFQFDQLFISVIAVHSRGLLLLSALGALFKERLGHLGIEDLNVDLYHYYIGREGQSVQEEIMIRRIDQQILVNKLMMEQIDLEHVKNVRQRETILHYHDMITAVTSVLLIVGGEPEHLQKKRELWPYIRKEHPWEYRRLRRSLFGRAMNLPGRGGRKFGSAVYHLANHIFSFN